MKISEKVSAAESQSELPGTPQNPFGRSPERVENPMNRRSSDAKWQLLGDVGLGISLGAVLNFTRIGPLNISYASPGELAVF